VGTTGKVGEGQRGSDGHWRDWIDGGGRGRDACGK